MKRILVAFCLSLFLPLSVFASIASGADKIIHQQNPNVNLGMVVMDLSSGETLYNKNANHLFIPASNMKLFSEAAALMILGPDYRFENQLSTTAAQIQQGELRGDLYIHLRGDPSFSRYNLRNLLAALNRWQVRSILGNVIIDSSLASVPAYPPGWLNSDLGYSYGAPIAPLMLDANRLTVTVNPGSRAGDPAIVEADDGEGHSILINNQVKTVAKAKACGLGFTLDAQDHLTVTGCVGLSQWAYQQQIAIKNPLIYAEGLIKHELEKMNIQFNGHVLLGKAPSGSLILATEYSKPLVQLMADTLKPSDNLYADSLYLHAAAKLKGRSVGWKEAEPVIKSFLHEQTGINFSNAVFTDGSGLSRYNLVTPEQTISLLKFLYERFPLSYEYIAALPVSGRDGTLQKRFRIPSQQGFVRAKTGTMTGMNSLSGFMYTVNGHTLAFAMYINRVPGKPAGPGRPLLDALVTYFLQQSPSNLHLAKVFAPHSRMNFQLKSTQADLQRRHQAGWRRLESGVKMALRGQEVNILYRGNELIINDNQADANKVWSSLALVSKTHSFAVALNANNLPMVSSGNPKLTWVQQNTLPGKVQRQWIIREAI